MNFSLFSFSAGNLRISTELAKIIDQSDIIDLITLVRFPIKCLNFAEKCHEIFARSTLYVIYLLMYNKYIGNIEIYQCRSEPFFLYFTFT